MSDHRYTAIFGGALLTAGAATFAVYHLLSAATTTKREPTRTVVVAVRDVPAGVPVPREALGIASWPVRVAPADGFAVTDSIVGRVTRTALMSGEPVLTSRLATRGAPPGLEGTIDPTRRAMAVRVNEAASVSGLVRPNSRVDVLMAGRGDGGTQLTARVLMTDVRVLGVGSVRPPDPQSAAADQTPNNAAAAVVTLEVTPSQAEALAAAEGQGAIQVVLRGYGSVGTVASTPADAPQVAPFSVGLGQSVAGVPRGMGAGPGTMAGAKPTPTHEAAHATRRVARSANVASAAAIRPVDSTAAGTPRAEPAVIQIYRGSTLTTLRVDAPNGSTPPGGAGLPRSVSMADAHAGTGARPAP